MDKNGANREKESSRVLKPGIFLGGFWNRHRFIKEQLSWGFREQPLKFFKWNGIFKWDGAVPLSRTVPYEKWAGNSPLAAVRELSLLALHAPSEKWAGNLSSKPFSDCLIAANSCQISSYIPPLISS